MYRREFIQKAAAGAFALSLPKMPAFLKDVPMGVVVHSYGFRWNSRIESNKYPGFTNAIELVDHCKEIGAGGVQTVVKDWSADFAKKLRNEREKAGLYLEGSIGLPKKPEQVAAFEQEVINAKEAGAVILRTVCSSGRRYETYHSNEEWQALKKNALVSLQLAEPVLKKHKVKLAVENHKDWRATELVEILKQINSEWIGVTLDFGNSISLLEDPMVVVETLSPYVFTTHVKDMGVAEYADGFLLSEVPLGKGILDLPKMISLCKKHNPAVTFNLEMITRDPLEIPCRKAEYWSTFGDIPKSDMDRTLRMVKEQTYKAGLPRVSQLSGDEKLAVEEKNIVDCLSYSNKKLRLK